VITPTVILGRVTSDHFHLWNDFRIFLLMNAVPLFRTLPTPEQIEMYSLLQHEEFKDGQYIVKQGDIGDKFYVIIDGAADVVETVIADDQSSHETLRNVVLARLYEGHFFGEMSLIYEEPRVASVVAVGLTSCLYITKDLFHDALSSKQFQGTMEKISSRRNDARQNRLEELSLEYFSPLALHDPSIEPIPDSDHDAKRYLSFPITRNAVFRKSDKSQYLNSYEMLREIGRGSYGIVYKSRNCNNNELVAIKSINRNRYNLSK
jgi:CRP-like cAMP-binding protein